MQLNRHFDPFALMVHPETVIQAMEGSERLRGLERRVCRPLDKMTPAQAREDGAAYDALAASGAVDYSDILRA